ncbi:TPA: hypothetical protein PZN16_003035, partial [Staphylococcus aureus]|nr:hypothetical protein [Staphylococcus aureus]
EALLEKETLRRPDLESIFDGIVPRDAYDVFPGEDDRFPRQIGYAPVKTPVELAKERGEELPKRMTLLDASRAARERRLAGEELKGEVGFNFGQHAGDYVNPETVRELHGGGSDSENRSGHDRADHSNHGNNDRGDRDGGEGRADSASESRGKHHKPEGETSQWFTPGWNESSRRDNPYARDAEKPRDDEK